MLQLSKKSNKLQVQVACSIGCPKYKCPSYVVLLWCLYEGIASAFCYCQIIFINVVVILSSTFGFRAATA